VAVLLLVGVSIVKGDGLSSSITPQLGGGIGGFDGGISFGIKATPLSPCGVGAIDLSAGCPMPMLGVF